MLMARYVKCVLCCSSVLCSSDICSEGRIVFMIILKTSFDERMSDYQ